MKFTFIFSIFILIFLSGCKELKMPTLDDITMENIEKAIGFGKVIYDASKDITQEQEYYIGRSVAANILGRYKLYNNEKVFHYVNSVGALLVINSNQPEIFAGYHFNVLDSDEINAFATPGGFIFITRGLLRICKNEDELAAVLAHEISHVQLRHGISSIKDSRWTAIATTLGTKTIKEYGSEDLVKLTKSFEDSIEDIVNTLVVNGYSRSYEYEADGHALEIMKNSSYNDFSMITMLLTMKNRLKNDNRGFASTHPKTSQRITSLTEVTEKSNDSIPLIRNKRFKMYMKNV